MIDRLIFRLNVVKVFSLVLLGFFGLLVTVSLLCHTLATKILKRDF